MDAFLIDCFGDRVNAQERGWGKEIIGNTNIYRVGNGRGSNERDREEIFTRKGSEQRKLGIQEAKGIICFKKV